MRTVPIRVRAAAAVLAGITVLAKDFEPNHCRARGGDPTAETWKSNFYCGASRIDGISGKSTPVTVVQWLRFGGPTTLRIIGSAPRDQWATAFTRFRAVRDGIQPR